MRVTCCVIVLLFQRVYATTNFAECMSKLRNGTFGTNDTGATDEYGGIIPVIDHFTSANVAGMLYPTCVKLCGTGPDNFNWAVFSQSISAWLLPSLALLSQLPFGNRRHLNGFVSLVMTIGSPVLAGYSLSLTLLNQDYLAKRFSGIHYPNAHLAVRVLNNLQHVPIALERGHIPSVIILPENDQWWEDLDGRINFSRTWTIPAVTSIIWVLLAYVFTVVTAFTTLLEFTGNPLESPGISDGMAVGASWLWLIAIVYGWTHVSPMSDDARLRNAIRQANTLQYIAGDAERVVPMLASELEEKYALSVLDQRDVDRARADEMASAPIYNYARLLSWSQVVEDLGRVYDEVQERTERHENPSNGPWVRRKTVDPENRRGTLEQLREYCDNAGSAGSKRNSKRSEVLRRIILSATMGLVLQWGTTGASMIILMSTPTKGLGCRSASYVLYASLSTFISIIFVIQTALAHYSAPSSRVTKLSEVDDELELSVLAEAGPLDSQTGESQGREPASGEILIFLPPSADSGLLATSPEERERLQSEALDNVLLFQNQDHELDPSTPLLAAEPQSQGAYPVGPIERHTRYSWKVAGRYSAIGMRWLGKSLAFVNATWLLVTCILQFSNVYDTCFCNAPLRDMLSHSFSKAFDTMVVKHDVTEGLIGPWVGGALLGLGTVIVFVLFIFLFWRDL